MPLLLRQTKVMYANFKLALKYCRYYITASNGKGHGVHSPFVFNFITEVLNDDRFFYCYKPIEQLRQQLLANETRITVQDIGAGSRIFKNAERSICSIAASSLKPAKYARLLFRMVNYLQPQHILELGSSLGITTAYLASANINTTVFTIEGSPSVANVAQQNFNQLGLQNISLQQGNFDEVLQPLLQSNFRFLDFVFIDGNHRKEPTIRYFEQMLPYIHEKTVLIFDDIHWSREMEEAWEYIKLHEKVTLTVDLFFIGIVFFRKEQKEKQYFTIRF